MTSLIDQDATYLLSSELGITPDVMPPFDLFKQYYNAPELLQDSEKQELADFSFIIMNLAEHGDVNDRLGIKYISEFVTYYCPNIKNSNYIQLSDEGKNAVLSIYNHSSSYIMSAVEAANCTI